LIDLFRRKSLDQLVGESDEPQHRLKRVLGPVQLTLLEWRDHRAGIFSTVGTAASGEVDRPGRDRLSCCPLFSSQWRAVSRPYVMPSCGHGAAGSSAYTYAYATLGNHRLDHWLDLILEYAWETWPWPSRGRIISKACSRRCTSLADWLGTDLRSAIQAAQKVAEAKVAGVDLSL